MQIIEKVDEKNMLRIMVDSNEESLFSLLKTYMQDNTDVELVGLYKEHHLVDKTEFFLKTKSGSAMDLFKKSLKTIKKDLESKKIK
jgi:DNA-directed RNA polymerase subunit L